MIQFIPLYNLFDIRDIFIFILILGYPLLICLYILRGLDNEK